MLKALLLPSRAFDRGRNGANLAFLLASCCRVEHTSVRARAPHSRSMSVEHDRGVSFPLISATPSPSRRSRPRFDNGLLCCMPYKLEYTVKYSGSHDTRTFVVILIEE